MNRHRAPNTRRPESIRRSAGHRQRTDARSSWNRSRRPDEEPRRSPALWRLRLRHRSRCRSRCPQRPATTGDDHTASPNGSRHRTMPVATSSASSSPRPAPVLPVPTTSKSPASTGDDSTLDPTGVRHSSRPLATSTAWMKWPSELPTYELPGRAIERVERAVTAPNEHARDSDGRRRANGAPCLESPSNAALPTEQRSARDAGVRRRSAEHETDIGDARISHLCTSLARGDESREHHATNEAAHHCTTPGRGAHTMRRVSGVVSEGAANHAMVRRVGRSVR